jgi:PAS domain S-box-containing protein
MMQNLKHLSKIQRILFEVSFLLGALALHLLSAKIGQSLATINTYTSPVWPATGVAISLIYIFGYRAALPIWLSVFFINFGTGMATPWVAAVAMGNLLEALLAGYFLRRMERSVFMISSSQASLLRYFLLAVIPPLMSASIGTAALVASGASSWDMARVNWVTWWIGNAIGVLFVFPFVYEMREYLKIKHRPEFSLGIFTSWLLKGISLFAVLALTNYFVFGTTEGRPFLFVIFLGLLLAAHLFSFFIIYVSAAAISIFSILMTQHGVGPFQSGAINDSLVHLEFFLGMVWLTAVVLSNIKSSGSLRRPSGVLVIGWLLTGISFYSFFEASLRRSDSYFENKKTEAEIVLRETMNGYIRLLESGAALMTVDGNVTRTDWKIFLEGLKLTNRYPGLMGVGVIYALEGSELKKFSAEMNRSFPGFRVQDMQGREIKDSRGPHFVVGMIEPLKENVASIGFDAASEEIRREAIERSRDSGEPRLTGEIQLIQSPEGPGYSLFVPFYKRGVRLETIEERRKNIRGFLVAPIQAKAFFSAATQVFEPDLNLIYARPMVVSGWGELLNNDTLESYVDLAGNTHRLIWQKPKGLIIRSSLSASLVGFCGAFFTLVLVILVASLESIRSEAERIARDKTQEVIERERLWRTLTEISPNGIFLTDKNSKAFYVNKRWVEITNVPLEGLVHGRLKEVLHPEDIEPTYKAWSEFTSLKKPEFIQEYRLMVHGQWRYVCCHTVALKDAFGNLIGYLGTMQDLTERHHHQVALAQSARMSSLGQMAGGVAHEINNPLAIISGHAELLRVLIGRPAFEKEKVGEHINKIQTTVKRIAKIIRGLRSVAREVPTEPGMLYNVGQVFQDTFELCASRFQSHNVRLIYEADIGHSMDVLGHPEQLTQVLLNLLNNAFDAVEEQSEKWVEIVCYKQNNNIVIEVSDSGPGISATDRANLFEPFYTTKLVGKGTGLGLTISKSIIESQGGRLYLETSRAHTTFVVELKNT